MDIASLRRELEEHLKLNPHHEAPEGFRDRFEHWAEAYEAETDDEAKAELEALLRQVPTEAQAAATCGMDEGPQSEEEAPVADDAPRPEPPAPVADDAPRPEPPAPPARDSDEAPPGDDGAPAAAGDLRREEPMPAPEAGAGAGTWLLLAAIVLALAAAAYFYLAR